MFGNRIRLDKALLARAKRYSDMVGYSSVDEFVAHAVEKAMADLDASESEQQLREKLRGLGYLS